MIVSLKLAGQSMVDHQKYTPAPLAMIEHQTVYRAEKAVVNPFPTRYIYEELTINRTATNGGVGST
jgi:hypothetical protein